jgi:hypothetical protein
MTTLLVILFICLFAEPLSAEAAFDIIESFESLVSGFELRRLRLRGLRGVHDSA